MTWTSGDGVRGERRRVAVAIGIATLAAWAATWWFAWEMGTMDHAAMPPLHAQTWTNLDLLMAFLMWAAMMVAMMLPSALPMIDAVATIAGRRKARGDAYTPASVFVVGYLVVWVGFSAFATVVQWTLHKAALLTPMMENASPVMAGVLFLLAGAYQFAPFKYACLTKCRSPAAFVLTEWRDGAVGAVIMGLRHGGFCVGCCWALMGLLFAVSVMDLRWVAALALLVAIEKIAPFGVAFARALGIVSATTGIWLLARAAFG